MEVVKKMNRVILHCDLNGFYASVESLSLDEETRKKPMVVGGDAKSRHGIVLAKNEAAKKYGIVTAETLYQARKKCPDLLVLPPHHALYAHYSKVVNAVYVRYSDYVEKFGIDESWIDITHSMHLFGGPEATAHAIRETVKKETGLTISVGVSFNKIFAKLGSDYRKPDAVTVIMREDVKRMVHPMPVSNLLFVGKATLRILEANGIYTIGDLAKKEEVFLSRLLGKQGSMLYRYARGLDEEPVKKYYEQEEAKTIGNSMTFAKSLVGKEEIKTGTLRLADVVAQRLREAKKRCYGVQIGIKDDDFVSISRQKKLKNSICSTKDIYQTAFALIAEAWEMSKPVRLLNVTAIHLCEENQEQEQMSFFESPLASEETKYEKADAVLDEIRRKYGEESVGFARLLDKNEKKKKDEL